MSQRCFVIIDPSRLMIPMETPLRIEYDISPAIDVPHRASHVRPDGTQIITKGGFLPSGGGVVASTILMFSMLTLPPLPYPPSSYPPSSVRPAPSRPHIPVPVRAGRRNAAPVTRRLI